MMAEASPVPANPLLERLLERLANKDSVLFKLQTRNEPDLTVEDKTKMGRELFLASPSKFLARYHHHLQPEDAVCFAPFKDEYEVAFYLKEIENRNIQKLQRNRRYVAMNRLEQEGYYFSDTAMEEREPELYQEMVGRFDGTPAPSCRTFSEFLLRTLNSRGRMDQRMEEEMEEEEEDIEEFDTDEDEEEEEEKADDATSSVTGGGSCDEEKDGEEEDKDKEEEEGEDEEEKEEELAEDARAAEEEVQRNFYRQEFLSLMKEKFLRGEDKEFDYDSLNADLTLDDQEENDRDMEERYFDEEDPQDLLTPTSMDSDELTPLSRSVEVEVEAEMDTKTV